MSTRNPFEELERLFDRLSRRFEESSDWWEGEELVAPWRETMAVDLIEREDEFVVAVDLPGFERDEVDVDVTDHTLHIEAVHGESSEETDEDYLRRERRESSVRRSIRLPDAVETGGVSATMRNGVLTVTLPRAEVEESTRIDIE